VAGVVDAWAGGVEHGFQSSWVDKKLTFGLQKVCNILFFAMANDDQRFIREVVFFVARDMFKTCAVRREVE
jgi:hypothetical protein